jgi:hypothetical protein
LASFQSRITVSGETFNTSAVSSTLSPPKSKLYHAALSLVNSGQGFQCVIHRDQIGIRLAGDHQPFVQWYVHGISAPLLETARACEIGENATHQLRAHGEKVRPALPVDLPDIHQP